MTCKSRGADGATDLVSHKDQMVAIAKGIHLLPFRTEKLSPFTPMVLPQGGRVGSRLPLNTACRCHVYRLFLFYLAIVQPGSILIIFLIIFSGCKPKENPQGETAMDKFFQSAPQSLTTSSTFFESSIAATSIHDMDEPILCMSTKIDGQSTTYFIQPDKAALKDITIKYDDAQIADMGSALLIHDIESDKITLFYLPGKFPIDSLHIRPDAIFPVLGITMYQSEIEKISSRWTDIVCKCVSESALYDFRQKKINCDTGGNVESSCLLSNEGSVLTCKTTCRSGAMACCWFEF